MGWEREWEGRSHCSQRESMCVCEGEMTKYRDAETDRQEGNTRLRVGVQARERESERGSEGARQRDRQGRKRKQ